MGRSPRKCRKVPVVFETVKDTLCKKGSTSYAFIQSYFLSSTLLKGVSIKIPQAFVGRYKDNTSPRSSVEKVNISPKKIRKRRQHVESVKHKLTLHSGTNSNTKPD